MKIFTINKKALLLLVFQLSVISFAYAQPIVAEISFSIENTKVSGASPQYLEFDIYAKSNTNETYLDNAVFRLFYDEEVFGPNIALNQKITITRGSAFNYPTYRLPASYDVSWPLEGNGVTYQYNNLLGVSLTMDELNPGTINRVRITTSPIQLLHLKIAITKLKPTTVLNFAEYTDNIGADYSRYLYYSISANAAPFDAYVYDKAHFNDAVVNLAALGVYVAGPVDRSTNASYTLYVSAVPGASTYTVQLSSNPDFSGTTIIKSSSTNSITVPEMNFNTKYYARAQTNVIPSWGRTTSFTTGPPENYYSVYSPADGATNAIFTLYTGGPFKGDVVIEVNTKPDFTGTSVKKTNPSPTGIAFPELGFNTKYYTRVRLAAYPTAWGKTTSFTTGSPEFYCYVFSPSDGSTSSQKTFYTSNPPQATTVTLEFNTKADFTGTSIVKTNTFGVIEVPELIPGQKYYMRVKTNLSAKWGKTTSFTKAISSPARLKNEEPIEDNSQITSVSIYPNPATRNIVLSIPGLKEPYTVRLMDIYGKQVGQTIISDTKTEIDVSSLPTGLYSVIIYMDGKVVSKKLQVTH